MALRVSAEALRAKLQRARKRNIFRMISNEKRAEEGLFHQPTSIDSQADATGGPEIEFIPANYFAPLDLAQLFGRSAPLEISAAEMGHSSPNWPQGSRSEISSGSKNLVAGSDAPARKRSDSMCGTCAFSGSRAVTRFNISFPPARPRSCIFFFPTPGRSENINGGAWFSRHSWNLFIASFRPEVVFELRPTRKITFARSEICSPRRHLWKRLPRLTTSSR